MLSRRRRPRCSALTSSVGPAGLQAGDRDTVPGLWGVRQVKQAAAPVLHSPDRTVLQPRHYVPDWQTPGAISCRALLETHRQILKKKKKRWWWVFLKKNLAGKIQEETWINKHTIPHQLPPNESLSNRLNTKILQQPTVADLLTVWM